MRVENFFDEINKGSNDRGCSGNGGVKALVCDDDRSVDRVFPHRVNKRSFEFGQLFESLPMASVACINVTSVDTAITSVIESFIALPLSAPTADRGTMRQGTASSQAAPPACLY
jgi:hypothetical protein